MLLLFGTFHDILHRVGVVDVLLDHFSVVDDLLDEFSVVDVLLDHVDVLLFGIALDCIGIMHFKLQGVGDGWLFDEIPHD